MESLLRWKKWTLFDANADPGEKSDLSKQHPELLDKMIDGAAAWTEQHAPPQWFHTLEARDGWNEMGIPNPEAVFSEEARKRKR